MQAQTRFQAGSPTQSTHSGDALLLRVGVGLLVLIVVTFFWWRPWESRDPMPAGDWLLTYVDNNGRLAERREHVWSGIKTDEEAIRNLEGRYPNALHIRRSPPPRFSLRFSRGEQYFFAAALAPISMIVIGGFLRRRNRRAQRVGSLLRHTLETDVGELLRHTKFTRAQVEAAVSQLNNQGAGFFVWNRDSDTIEDGRLGSTFLHIERCESCGASIGLRVKASLKVVPRCSYCGSAVSTHDHLNALKQEAMSTLRSSDATALDAARRGANQPMSIWLFVFLIILCWPAAIAYAVYKSTANRAAV